MLLFLLMTLPWPINTQAITVVAEFKQSDDEFLGDPVDACFSPDGQLFIIDSAQSKIFAWDARGQFSRSFAQKGMGPGELQNPFSITASKERVYVWEDRQVISVFNHKGEFQKSFHTTGARPRSFGVLSDELLLLGYRSSDNDSMHMHTSLWHVNNGKGPELMNEINKAFLKIGEGDNNAYIKSYMPEVEVSTGPNGHLYYGFSQNNVIYEVDAAGKIVGQKSFDLPVSLPDESDKDMVMSMSFPGPGGQRLSLKDLPNIRMSFADPKAHYTHFLIRGDKIAFILTPIGSTDAVSNGYARGTYYVCDFNSGKVLSRNRYDLPEDSAVFYQNGRAIACTLDQEGEYRVEEISLAGL